MVKKNDESIGQTKELRGSLDQLINTLRTTTCKICGSIIPVLGLGEHMIADARMLCIIQTTHPEWETKKCETYLRSLFAQKSDSCPGINPIKQEDASFNCERFEA